MISVALALGRGWVVVVSLPPPVLGLPAQHRDRSSLFNVSRESQGKALALEISALALYSAADAKWVKGAGWMAFLTPRPLNQPEEQRS